MVQKTTKKVAKKVSKRISKANLKINTITGEEMPDYDQLKAEMEAIQKKMDIAKKLERKNALKTVKKLCKEFGFTASMLKDSLTEGRKRSKS
jgi:tRNA A37 threonylcarbamoyladenosine dehydratase